MTSEKLEKLIEKYHHNVTITGLGDENLSDEQVVAAIEKHVTQCGILYEVHQGVDVEPAKKDEPSEKEVVASPEVSPVSAEPAAPASEPAPAVADPEPKESKEEEARVEASTERSNNPKGPKGKK